MCEYLIQQCVSCWRSSLEKCPLGAHNVVFAVGLFDGISEFKPSFNAYIGTLKKCVSNEKVRNNWCNIVSEKEQTKGEEPAEVENKEESKEEDVETGKTTSKVSKEQNIVYIGNKPPMNYVMAVITAFNMRDTDNVVLKARGRAISTAVDVAEITRNRFFKDAKVHSIAIGTEEITPREGGNPRNVSTMEINLHK